MLNINNNEVQVTSSSFCITLLSGEIITLTYIQDEYIDECKDGTINITIESATYNDRLYEAFKNHELLQHIQKNSEYEIVDTHENISRTTDYTGYFTIDEFETHASKTSYSYYSIRIKSV